MSKVYLSLGSNIGNKKKHIDEAVKMLDSNDNINILKVSSFYETEPVGFENQDNFYNIALELETNLSPYELLDYCQTIEIKLKRKRLIKWGPRTIDIDVLLYEGITSNDEKLLIPHPRMTERAFVIIPLYELNKDIIINNKSIKDIKNDLKNDGVIKLEI